MKTTIEITLKPFTVPNYVIVESPPGLRQEGLQEAPKYHLKELSPETLERLCEQFKTAVFEKAEKSPPPTAVCGCNRS